MMVLIEWIFFLLTFQMVKGESAETQSDTDYVLKVNLNDETNYDNFNQFDIEQLRAKLTHQEFVKDLLTDRSEDSDILNNQQPGSDLLQPISIEPVPSVFKRSELKPVHKLNLSTEFPIQTNKFYTNIFLGLQLFSIFLLPYRVRYEVQHGGILVTPYGKTIFGNCPLNNPYSTFYLNPMDTPAVVFSTNNSFEFSGNLNIAEMSDLFVNLKFSETEKNTSVSFPLAQGSAFFTAIYENLDPLISFPATMDKFNFVWYSPSLKMYKYRVKLSDSASWLIYLKFDEIPQEQVEARLKSNLIYFKLHSNRTVVQVVMCENPDDEKYFDSSAGVYVTSVKVDASLARERDDIATYSIKYITNKDAHGRKPLVVAMRHHVQSMTYNTLRTATPIFYKTPVKGFVRAFHTDILEMSEVLGTKDISTLPWTSYMKSGLVYNSDDLMIIRKHAESEMKDIDSLFDKGIRSIYYKGKLISKYANLLVVLHNILKDEEMTKLCLKKLKEAYKEHTDNSLDVKLIYDTTYKGVTSTASELENNPNADFGSSYYNDHHFHYGYFVYTAGVIALVDKDLKGVWAAENKDWVNSLIRDVANPSSKDIYFPVFRHFDWYHGHSWSKGLFESPDGKDEESSSEDYNFFYGMKIWASALNDTVMEARADLIMSVIKRSFNNYFLYKDDNNVMYGDFAKNQVSGILFENKVDYTTYFGNPKDFPEYVHGIHILPISPVSSFFRDPVYSKSLWNQQLSNFVSKTDVKWQVLIRFVQVLFDPVSAYPEFLKFKNIEDKAFGISLAWAIAFAAATKNSVAQ